MKNKNLEGILQKLKKYKEAYPLLGSRAAYEEIMRIRRVKENPIAVANLINNAVGQTTYPATPERVVGLYRLLDNVYDIAYSKVRDEFLKTNPDREDDWNYVDNLIYQFSEVNSIGMFGDVYSNPYECVKKFTSFFEKARDRKVTNDSQFIFAVARELGGRAANETNKGEESFYYTEFIKNFKRLITRVSADSFLSKANFLDNQRKIIEYGSQIGLMGLIKRICDERVDHRLEYRQGILVNYIDLFKPMTYEEIVETTFKPMTYEEIVEIAKMQLRNRRERHSKLESLCAPKVVIESEENLIFATQILIRWLASEKKYVEKLLAQR